MQLLERTLSPQDELFRASGSEDDHFELISFHDTDRNGKVEACRSVSKWTVWKVERWWTLKRNGTDRYSPGGSKEGVRCHRCHWFWSKSHICFLSEAMDSPEFQPFPNKERGIPPHSPQGDYQGVDWELGDVCRVNPWSSPEGENRDVFGNFDAWVEIENDPRSFIFLFEIWFGTTFSGESLNWFLFIQSVIVQFPMSLERWR